MELPNQDRHGLVFGAKRTTRTTTFGEFVAGVYDSSDGPGAGAMVSLALDIGLLVFSEPEPSDDLPELGRNTRPCRDLEFRVDRCSGKQAGAPHSAGW